MKRVCNEDDVIVLFLRGDDKPCGRTYDDVDHSTICPHEELGTKGLVCKESDLYRSVCPHCIDATEKPEARGLTVSSIVVDEATNITPGLAAQVLRSGPGAIQFGRPHR